MRPIVIRWAFAAIVTAFAIGAAVTKVHAGVDLGAAVKSGNSAEEWISNTVKANRSDWRSFEEIPDALFNVFYGAPFSEFLKNAVPPAGTNKVCAGAAFDVAYQAVNQWENLSGSAIGGFIQFGKRWYARAQTALGAIGLAKAEGELFDKLKDAAVEKIKDEAKDIGKEAGKDAVKTGDPAIQQKIEDRVTDVYNKIRDYFKSGPVVFWDTRIVGSCSVAMLWLWDGSKLDLYIYGNCGCNTVTAGGRSTKVRSFALHIEAKTYLDRSDPAKPRFAVSPYDGMRLVEFKADCDCDGKTAMTVPKAPPPPPPPPPYRPVEETRTTCEPCKAQLAKVIDIQKQIAAVESEILDKAGERSAAEAEIRLAKDTGKPEPESAVNRLKDLARDNIRLVNKKIQLTAAWREASKELDDCEKRCRTETATPGRPVHGRAASSMKGGHETTEKKKGRKKDDTKRGTTTENPPPGMTFEFGIGVRRDRERERDRRKDERRIDDGGRREIEISPGITFGR